MWKVIKMNKINVEKKLQINLEERINDIIEEDF